MYIHIQQVKQKKKVHVQSLTEERDVRSFTLSYSRSFLPGLQWGMRGLCEYLAEGTCYYKEYCTVQAAGGWLPNTSVEASTGS